MTIARAPVVIAAGPGDASLADLWNELLRTARHADDALAAAPASPASAAVPTQAAQAIEVCGVPDAVRRARGFLDAGFRQLVIVPLPASAACDGAFPPDDLAEAVTALRRAYPRAVIHDPGRNLDGDAARALGDLVAIPQQVSDDLLAGTIARGFGGEPARLAAFVALLRRALPDDTMIALRGSAVMGRAFRDGASFDAHGPGSSDLDLVVVGDDATELWVPEARLLGGINTLPLNDEAPWAAPTLDPPRREAQAMAGRPLSIQAMARWFLDLRVALQGTPYVILAVPS